ncbi:MAG: ABC transporter permease [Gammaproteobacteria bacterium]
MVVPKWLTITAWLIFLAAVYWPICQLVLDAFSPDEIFITSDSSNGFFLSEAQYDLLERSLILASGATVLALMIGIPFAFFIQRTTMWGREVFRLLYLLPLLVPPYMQAIVWSGIFAEESRMNRFLMKALPWQSAPLEVHNLAGAIVILAFSYFPLVTLLAVGGLNNLDAAHEEAALLYGGRFKTVFSITLPMIIPQILAGAIFVFIFSIIDFGVPDILRLRVYPVEIFIEYSAMYNERSAVMLAAPLLAITSILIALETWLMKGKAFISFYRQVGLFPLVESRNINCVALCYCLAVILISVVIPFAWLIEMAGPVQNFPKAWAASAGTIGFSLLMAILGATVMVVLAFFLAHSLTKSTGILKLILDYLTQLPFALPPVLLGIGLTKAWNQPSTDWIYSSSAMIAIGYLAHLIPFVIRIIYAGLRQIPTAFEEAGLLTGHRWWLLLKAIILPVVGSSLLAGVAIGFVFALADLGTSLLIMPPGSETMPIVIYNYLHYGAGDFVAVFCLMLLCFQFIVLLGLAAFNRRIDKLRTVR